MMHQNCRVLLLVCMVTSAAAALRAQTVTYARVPGDTLRFHEETRIEGTSKGRAGNQTVGIDVHAKISLTFVSPDSARAWYDSLAVAYGGVMGSQQVATQSALRSPFVLRMRGTGVVETLHSPELPGLVRDLADFTPQFDDFFPRLPLADLTPGASWADTIVRRESSAPGRQLFVQRIIHSRVDGDTTVGRQPAVRISISTELHIESTIPIQRQAYTARLVLNGSETGSALVSRSGKLLSRERKGEIHGATTYHSGANEIAVDQSYTFHGLLLSIDPRP